MAYVAQGEKAVKAAAAGKVTENSYVTVSDKYKDVADAGNGPLEPGKYGQVIKDDKSDKPFKVGRHVSGSIVTILGLRVWTWSRCG